MRLSEFLQHATNEVLRKNAEQAPEPTCANMMNMPSKYPVSRQSNRIKKHAFLAIPLTPKKIQQGNVKYV
jgi:hypothetical protein